MKRARLDLPPRPAGATPDLTDRLLAAAPERKRSRKKTAPAPVEARGPALPDAAAEVTPEQALEQVRLALAALTAAAHSVPARSNLAVRYRLDALAQHIDQVAQFLAHP